MDVGVSHEAMIRYLEIRRGTAFFQNYHLGKEMLARWEASEATAKAMNRRVENGDTRPNR